MQTEEQQKADYTHQCLKKTLVQNKIKIDSLQAELADANQKQEALNSSLQQNLDQACLEEEHLRKTLNQAEKAHQDLQKAYNRLDDELELARKEHD